MVWESSPRRAFKDTKKWLLGSFVAWIIVTVVFAMIGAIFAPSTDTIYMRALWGFVGAVVAIISIVGITYFVHLLLAPVRQRNELRVRIEEQEKPDKNLAIRNQLGIYLMETIQLQVKCLDESTPLTYEEVADWHNKIGLYIGENVGQDYEASFRSTEGLFTTQVGNEIKSEIHRNCMRLVCKDAVAIQELLAELRNK